MTDLDLTGRKALVTGGAQGLGEGMARALAAAGATRRRSPTCRTTSATKVAESLGDGHGFVHLDVTDDASWEAAIGRRPSTASAGSTSWSTTPGVEITSLLVDLDPADVRKHARGQPPRHRARHQARPSAPCGPAARPATAAASSTSPRSRRRSPSPASRSTPATKSGGRPADPGRGDGGRQARLRRPGQLHLPRAWCPPRWAPGWPTTWPSSACSARPRRRSAPSSS